jgi:hypothetical protein
MPLIFTRKNLLFYGIGFFLQNAYGFGVSFGHKLTTNGFNKLLIILNHVRGLCDF